MNRQSTPNDDEQHPNGPDTSDIAAPTAANAGAAAAAAADSDPFDSTASVAPGDAVPAAQPDSERTAEELLGLRPQLPPRSAFARALRARSDRRLRARRVRRLVRHIEPWSVLKVSLILYFCVWVIMLFVGVTLWNLAENSGLVSNVENFVVELFALESFTINADQIFRIAAVGGLVMVVAGSGATVLAAVLFNLISDVTGGVRLTVVEEETARPRARRGRRRVLVAAPPPGSGDPRTRR
ncbi:MAG: DUF3566 domain-containing protein [Acidimicrobiaceae bacterium]|nr:DUF3566 domain-containing protein [Acidimicrobiaceae bacterium]